MPETAWKCCKRCAADKSLIPPSSPLSTNVPPPTLPHNCHHPPLFWAAECKSHRRQCHVPSPQPPSATTAGDVSSNGHAMQGRCSAPFIGRLGNATVAGHWSLAHWLRSTDVDCGLTDYLRLCIGRLSFNLATRADRGGQDSATLDVEAVAAEGCSAVIERIVSYISEPRQLPAVILSCGWHRGSDLAALGVRVTPLIVQRVAVVKRRVITDKQWYRVEDETFSVMGARCIDSIQGG
ncbi:hypothetical protein DFH27DRAFT_617577 [Peziza echinospora]|nr:hypothetical protein DFH27DRAFT_617577 [Peziza echinospora]